MAHAVVAIIMWNHTMNTVVNSIVGAYILVVLTSYTYNRYANK